MTIYDVVVIGGGAAGFFGAIACAEKGAEKILILEKTRQPLAKVRISGGGRCNVTHACFDPAQLVQYYPRGQKALRGPFTRFNPLNTIEWFEQHHVKLKTEQDGRMFPITDSSQTIIDCLMNEAESWGIEIRLLAAVEKLERKDDHYEVSIKNNPPIKARHILLATGSHAQPCEWARQLGHTIIPPVPSLFTFNVPDSPLIELSGIAVDNVTAKITDTSLEQTGPLLITHWGFSGPAILKLSAWGARILHDLGYHAELTLNWLSGTKPEVLLQQLKTFRQENLRRQVGSESPVKLPRNLWKKLMQVARLDVEGRWNDISNDQLSTVIKKLLSDRYQIKGKSTYKEEFVTCGGIHLDEVNFKTMESRVSPGLYFAGEILDIDGVTGGFNFQNAWTTAWIAAQSISQGKE